eukprot:498024_1
MTTTLLMIPRSSMEPRIKNEDEVSVSSRSCRRELFNRQKHGRPGSRRHRRYLNSVLSHLEKLVAEIDPEDLEIPCPYEEWSSYFIDAGAQFFQHPESLESPRPRLDPIAESEESCEEKGNVQSSDEKDSKIDDSDEESRLESEKARQATRRFREVGKVIRPLLKRNEKSLFLK